jgi:hypothetical protein
VNSRKFAASCSSSSCVVCWAVVGIAVEDGSSWSMDMLGHSGGTLYKQCRYYFFSQSGAAVELTRTSASVDIEEHGVRETKEGCLTATHKERTGVTTSFARARAPSM